MLKLNEKSWLYKIYELGGGNRYMPDLCHFTRRCLIGILLGTLITVIAIGILCIIGAEIFLVYELITILPTYWAGAWVAFSELSMAVITANIMLIVLTIYFGLIYFFIAIVPRGFKRTIHKVEDITISKMMQEGYRGWKEKYCPTIEIIK